MRNRREARVWRKVAHDMRKAANRVAQVCHDLSLDSGVSPGVSVTGHVTLRCSICGKVCYKDQQSAEAAVAKIPDPMEAYLSPRCGFWHLATIRP